MAADNSRKLDKTNVEDILALTPTQEGMLFHYVSGQDQGYYVQQLALTLSGDLCIDTLRQAWQIVVSNNEMLRTVYRWNKLEHPVQIVLKSYLPPIAVNDYSEVPADEGEALAREAQERDRLSGLDLETQPLRILLCRLGERRCRMIVSWHHILFDGWSNGVMLKQWMEAYDSLRQGSVPERPRKADFKTFIKWHQQQDKQQHRRFWQQYMQGWEERTALPCDAESGGNSGSTSHRTLRFSPEETAAMRELAGSAEVTLAALLYSVWGVLLQAYNQAEDVMFGTTVSGRVPSIAHIEQTVGLFINTIPLRIQCGLQTSVRELLAQVDEALKQRGEYENTPLVDIAEYSGLSGREQLFDSIVVLENYPLDEGVRAGRFMQIESFEMRETTHYSLTIGVQTFDDLELDFSYRTDSFTPEMIARMADHFRHVARQMIASPSMAIGSLQLVTEAEAEQIVRSFNGPLALAAEPLLAHQRFEQQAERSPGSVAVIHDDRSYTYAEINARANGFAKLLRSHGVKPDTLVAVVAERSADFIVAMLGVLKAGGCYIPIDHEYAPARIAHILQDSAAGILVTQQRLAGGIAFAGTVLAVDDERLYAPDSACLELVSKPEHLAYVIYTSGSTGNPKGVMVEHGNLAAYVNAFQREFAPGPDDVILQQASCSFDQFIEESFPLLLSGGALVVARKTDVLDMNKLLRLVERHRITMVSVQPLLLNEFAKRDGMESVHTFISGGDVLKPEHCASLLGRARVYNTYGPTEGTVCAAYYRCDGQERRNIPIGKPILNYHVYIVDAANRLLPVGVPGEICIAGYGVARGYLHNEELTAAKFQPNPFHPGGRMYRTGDIGRWLPDGNLQFLGRNDEQVKVRGFRIEPGEIEHHLLGHAAVEEAVVLPAEDAHGVKCIAAYVKLRDEVNAGELKEHLAERLPNYMIPAHFYRIDRIPMTANAKVDRKALLACVDRLDSGAAETGEAGEAEQRIRHLWQEVLKQETIGLHDNFFDIGGNSILLMQLHAKLEKSFAAAIPIVDLFSYPTVSKLAQRLERQDEALDERSFGDYQPLPKDFFARQGQASGVGVMRFQLPPPLAEAIRQTAGFSQTELIDVLAAMYGYLFTQVNSSKTATIQCALDNGATAAPVTVDLPQASGFPALFQAVRSQRAVREGSPGYSIGKAVQTSRPKADPLALPLIYQHVLPSIDAKFLEVYDIALGVEENSAGQTISFTCKFNDRRLSKDKIQLLMKAYMSLLQQLAQSQVRS